MLDTATRADTLRKGKNIFNFERFDPFLHSASELVDRWTGASQVTCGGGAGRGVEGDLDSGPVVVPLVRESRVRRGSGSGQRGKGKGEDAGYEYGSTLP
jgi:hypothetical protein